MTSSSVGAWRLAALQLLAAAERVLQRHPCRRGIDMIPEGFEQFRDRVAVLRTDVEELEGDRVEFMPDWVRCDLVRNPRPGSVTYVSDLEEYNRRIVALDAGRADEPRFWILAEEHLERERQAREEFMRAVGMV